MRAGHGLRVSHQPEPEGDSRSGLMRLLLSVMTLSTVTFAAGEPCREMIVVEGAGLEVGYFTVLRCFDTRRGSPRKADAADNAHA